MIGFTFEDVRNANTQYRKLEMSKSPAIYYVETLLNGEWTYRMENDDKDYLNSAGQRWVDLKFCDDYRVIERK